MTQRRPTAGDLRVRALAGALIAAPLAASPGAAADIPAASGERIVLEFRGSIAHLPVVRAALDARVDAESYAGDLTFRSAGLAGFFKTSRVEGRGRGLRSGGGFTPAAYTHTEITGKKRRDIRLEHTPDDVVVEAVPPFGSLGQPAPSPAQKAEALDPLAMVLQIALADGDDPCSRVVPVFDSKLRYDLEFHPDGVEENLRTDGYRGPAVRCRVYYRPIAGYDPEDLADDDVYATPVRIWLAEVSPGVLAPALIRARYDLAFLHLVAELELSKARIEEGAGGRSG